MSREVFTLGHFDPGIQPAEAHGSYIHLAWRPIGLAMCEHTTNRLSDSFALNESKCDRSLRDLDLRRRQCSGVTNNVLRQPPWSTVNAHSEPESLRKEKHSEKLVKILAQTLLFASYKSIDRMCLTKQDHCSRLVLCLITEQLTPTSAHRHLEQKHAIRTLPPLRARFLDIFSLFDVFFIDRTV